MQHKYACLWHGRDHAKRGNFKARIKPKTGIAVSSRAQQVLEHGRTRYSTSVTIAREGGTRAEVKRGSERREENEFIFLSGVASCKHIVCGSRYEPRCPDRDTSCRDL